MAKRKATIVEDTNAVNTTQETITEITDTNVSENVKCPNACDCGNEEQTQYVSTSSNFTYGLDESFVLEDISARNLYINGKITAETFNHIYYFITRFNAEDVGVKVEERVPIKLHIQTVGGSAWDGLGVTEIIQNSVTPVIGICMSYAASMGFYIFLACDVRYATENAFLLRHEGEDGDYGHPSKVKEYLAFSDKLQERLDKIVIRNSNISARDLRDTERMENYIFADEAKDLGIVDYIIGQDCSLEDIL